MAVRFDASTDRLLRTAGMLDYNADYTWMCWVYFTTLGTFFTIGCMNDNSDNNADQFRIAGSGTNFGCRGTNGGTGGSSTGSLTISAGIWYHVALVRSGNVLTNYINGVSDSTVTQSISGRTALTRMEMGAKFSTNSSRMDGRIAATKIYNTAMTIDAIKREMLCYTPLRQENLYGWYPSLPIASDRARDYSINGYNWTEGGTLTNEADPPIPWSIRPILIAAPPPDIVVTPGTGNAVVNSIAPTIVLGSLTLAPNTSNAAVNSIAPTIVLGSVALTPTTVDTVASSVAPTIIQGSLTVTPTASDSIAAIVAPAIALGSLTLTPNPIVATAVTVDPTVDAGGNVSVSPSPVEAAAIVIAPTAIQGSLTIAPNTSNAATAIVAPSIAYGSIVIAPVVVTVRCVVVAPSVSTGTIASVPEDHIYRVTFDNRLFTVPFDNRIFRVR